MASKTGTTSEGVVTVAKRAVSPDSNSCLNEIIQIEKRFQTPNLLRMANPKVTHNRITLAGVYNIRYKDIVDYESISKKGQSQTPTIKTELAVNHNYQESPTQHSPSIMESSENMKDDKELDAIALHNFSTVIK